MNKLTFGSLFAGIGGFMPVDICHQQKLLSHREQTQRQELLVERVKNGVRHVCERLDYQGDYLVCPHSHDELPQHSFLVDVLFFLQLEEHVLQHKGLTFHDEGHEPYDTPTDQCIPHQPMNDGLCQLRLLSARACHPIYVYDTEAPDGLFRVFGLQNEGSHHWLNEKIGRAHV